LVHEDKDTVAEVVSITYQTQFEKPEEYGYFKNDEYKLSDIAVVSPNNKIASCWHVGIISGHLNAIEFRDAIRSLFKVYIDYYTQNMLNSIAKYYLN